MLYIHTLIYNNNYTLTYNNNNNNNIMNKFAKTIYATLAKL